jgi:hypothetical protein
MVPQHEDDQAYRRLCSAYLDEWKPATPTEKDLVLEMANARWRLQRIQRLITEAIDRYTESAANDIDTLAGFSGETNQKAIESLERMEARLQSTFHRALKTLKSLQAERVFLPAAGLRPVSKNSENEKERNEPTNKQTAPRQSLAANPEGPRELRRPARTKGPWDPDIQ